MSGVPRPSEVGPTRGVASLAASRPSFALFTYCSVGGLGGSRLRRPALPPPLALCPCRGTLALLGTMASLVGLAAWPGGGWDGSRAAPALQWRGGVLQHPDLCGGTCQSEGFLCCTFPKYVQAPPAARCIGLQINHARSRILRMGGSGASGVARPLAVLPFVHIARTLQYCTV